MPTSVASCSSCPMISQTHFSKKVLPLSSKKVLPLCSMAKVLPLCSIAVPRSTTLALYVLSLYEKERVIPSCINPASTRSTNFGNGYGSPYVCKFRSINERSLMTCFVCSSTSLKSRIESCPASSPSRFWYSTENGRFLRSNGPSMS